jgi:predicted O-linked N-acetylglucosamine transferase (SPINDLY family)
MRNVDTSSTDSADWLKVRAAAACLSQAGDFEGAIQIFDEFIARCPSNAEAHYKRANALNIVGRNEEALAAFDRAISLDPDYGHAFCNRGSALEKLHRLDEALQSYDRAIDIDAKDYVAHYNRANVLRQLGSFEESLVSYDDAIFLKSDFAEAFVNRGNVLQEMWRHEVAIESYDRAIELKPVFAAAFQGRGASLYQLKRLDAAIASFDQALALNPGQKFILGMRQYMKMQLCDWRDMKDDWGRIASGIKQSLPVSPPHPVLAQTDSASLQRLAAEIWFREECQCSDTLGRFRIGDPKRKLSIGYFSPDFRNHPVSQLAVELFEGHDRSRFDITAFAMGPESNDDMRARLQRAFDRFINVRDRSDVNVASLARQLGIDIAVDLGGYTEHSRTKVFALKAAPIQVNFLGYPGTMGDDFMDYLIADRTVVPEEQQRNYAEKIIYLPDCYLPGASVPAIATTVFSRGQLGLPENGFVFCCFNNAYKITPSVFDCWMRILGRVEGSVLWLAQSNPIAAENLRREASQRGVAAHRLIFAHRTDSLAEHIARLSCADLFLDTFPYNAHSTALDVLGAAVPMITRCGEAFAGRVAASMLKVLDLPELITATPEHYEELAVDLAANPDLLSNLRRKIARRRHSSPLFNARIFVSNLEAAYLAIYERYLKGLAPDHIWL